MPSYRDDGQLGEEITALLPHYRESKTEVIRAAVHLLWRLRQTERIKDLILDIDMDLEDVVMRAVAELWQREIGAPDRDLAAEIDALRQRLDVAGL